MAPTKKLSPTLSLMLPALPLIMDHMLERKVTLIAFRQTLPRILLPVRIFRSTIMTYLKKFVWIKSIKEQWKS